MEKLSFTAIYKLLSSELFNKKQVNKEIPEWLRVCFIEPFRESNATDLIELVKEFDAPASGNNSANFFNKRLDSSNTDFRIRLADYLMAKDGQSLNDTNINRLKTSISAQLTKKIEESRRSGELYSKSEPDDTIVHNIVEKLCGYDFGSAEDLCGTIQKLNRTDPYLAYMLITIVSLFGEKKSGELSYKQSRHTIEAAQKFETLSALLTKESKPKHELIREKLINRYYNGDVFQFNYEWQHFISSGGELIGMFTRIEFEEILRYAVFLSENMKDNFSINNNNELALKITSAGIAASMEMRSDISVCLLILQLYNINVICLWQKKNVSLYRNGFEEAKEYHRQVLTMISDSNDLFDMSEETRQKRKLLEKQISNGVPVTINFLYREAIFYSFTYQLDRSVDVFFSYISALSRYSGDNIDTIRNMIASAENDLAFVMLKSIDLANAEKYFELSLRHRMQLITGKEKRLAAAYTNLATLKLALHEYDAALENVENVYSIRKKLLEAQKIGISSLLQCTATYTSIYIHIAFESSGKKRSTYLQKAREKMNEAFHQYDMILSSGSESGISVSRRYYVRCLYLAGEIKKLEGKTDEAIAMMKKACQLNSESCSDSVEDMYNYYFRMRDIKIRLLLSEILIEDGRIAEIAPELVVMKEELQCLRSDANHTVPGKGFTTDDLWALYNIISARYLIETGAEKIALKEHISEAKAAADRLCTTYYTFNDRYRSNNRKAFGKLADYAYHELPFIDKGKKSSDDIFFLQFFVL